MYGLAPYGAFPYGTLQSQYTDVVETFNFKADLIASSSVQAALNGKQPITGGFQISAELSSALKGYQILQSSLQVSAVASSKLSGAISVNATLLASMFTQANVTGFTKIGNADLLVESQVGASLRGKESLTLNTLAAQGSLVVNLSGIEQLQAGLSNTVLVTATLTDAGGGVAFTSSLNIAVSMTGVLSGKESLASAITTSLLTASALSGFSSIASSLTTSVIVDGDFTVEANYFLQATLGIQATLFANLSVSEGAWDAGTVIGTETSKIIAIALTFDQLGHALVVYQTEGDIIKLLWYDPVAQATVNTVLGNGVTPAACFDRPDDPDNPDSDAWVFYARGNVVYGRLQRDRWNTEYVIRTYDTPVYIRKAGIAVNSRLQIVVDTQGACPLYMETISQADAASVGVFFEEIALTQMAAPAGEWGYLIGDKCFIAKQVLFAPTKGLRIALRIAKPYTSCNSTVFVHQGGYNNRNWSRDTSLKIYEFKGHLYVEFNGKGQRIPAFWDQRSAQVPAFSFDLTIGLSGAASITCVVGTESVHYIMPENYPMDVRDIGFHNVALGGVVVYNGRAVASCPTILRDFVYNVEEVTTSWGTPVSISLGVYESAIQGIFKINDYSSGHWVQL